MGIRVKDLELCSECLFMVPCLTRCLKENFYFLLQLRVAGCGLSFFDIDSTRPVPLMGHIRSRTGIRVEEYKLHIVY
jgi:hypothetical protein